jgi:hypothetical protein
MNQGLGSVLRVSLLVGVIAGLAGCESIRDASGAGKDPPDEFAVTTNPALVIPPDFNLRPPKAGAAPTNQVEPTDAAEEALTGTNPAVAAAGGQDNASEGEKLLIANAGGQKTDPRIRQDLVSDETQLQAASDDFTNQLLFWQKAAPTTPDAPLNADQEAARLAAQKSAKNVVGVNQNTSTPAADTDSATIEKTKKSDDSSGGWFDWF